MTPEIQLEFEIRQARDDLGALKHVGVDQFWRNSQKYADLLTRTGRALRRDEPSLTKVEALRQAADRLGD